VSKHELDGAGPVATDAWDVVIVGSGFGGSVSALRLAEKGYRVAVVEAGRRFSDSDFAKTSWRIRDFLWAPHLGCYGIQRIHLLPHTLVLAGAGVGGGSLVYANTLYVPPEEFFTQGHWSGITDWWAELEQCYDQAKRMLGVVTNPTMTPADEAMKQVAERLGVGHTFKLTPVGVFFGDGPGCPSPDPFFGGAGPARTGCVQCGECMTGCRHDAKNTLPKNYLGLAEAAGVSVIPMTTVDSVRPVGTGGWEVATHRTGRPAASTGRTLKADNVIISSGAYNSSKFLLRMRDTGVLPALSPMLGKLARTNSESLVGAVADAPPQDGPDYTTGVAITSSFFPDPDTHIEPVRYGRGSNVMGLLTTVMTDGGSGPRWRAWVKAVGRDPLAAIAPLWVRKWSQRSIIALVMQSVDNSLTLFGRRDRLGRWHMSSRQGDGEPNPTWIPIANEAVRELSRIIGGRPMGNLGEVIDAPMTAHFVGGVVMGESADTGVIDPFHRVHNYPGLYVVDGSSVSANLGVNPSLTITAMAERAASMWPNKGEPDPRPLPGAGYQRVRAVSPRHPAVPAGAPGELRL
jgi:cholesterol oxidase